MQKKSICLKFLQDQHESNIQQALTSERNLKESLVRDFKNEIKELTKKIKCQRTEEKYNSQIS